MHQLITLPDDRDGRATHRNSKLFLYYNEAGAPQLKENSPIPLKQRRSWIYKFYLHL